MILFIAISGAQNSVWYTTDPQDGVDLTTDHRNNRLDCSLIFYVNEDDCERLLRRQARCLKNVDSVLPFSRLRRG